MKTTRAILGTTVLGLGAAATGVLAASPAQAAPAPAKLCSISYANPNVPFLKAASTASAIGQGGGALTVKLATDANDIAGYAQTLKVTWANLTTGLSGSSDDVTATVKGKRTVLTLPDLQTGSGKVALVVGVTNHGIIPQSPTNGDCSATVTVA